MSGLLLAGCATQSSNLLIGSTQPLTRSQLAKVLVANPLEPDQNMRVAPVSKSRHASIHVVQVRWAEKPHIHEMHDLTVFVARGSGEITIGTETHRCRDGDVIHIPAGVRHYFTNKGSSPAVAVVVFSPPFDGKDAKPME